MKQVIKEFFNDKVEEVYQQLILMPQSDQLEFWRLFRKTLVIRVQSMKKHKLVKPAIGTKLKFKRYGGDDVIELEGRHVSLRFPMGRNVDAALYKGDTIVSVLCAITSIEKERSSDPVGEAITTWLGYVLSDKDYSELEMWKETKDIMITQQD
jgi:hypothetical protein